jgi:DNA-binding MurR/RpiR family transcriptional regulator
MIFDQIREVYPSLTKSQKRLADFIASSYREAAFMTASRLAHQLNLNEATVIRFAQRLGYAGYPQMIEAIQEIVQAELGATAHEAKIPENPLAQVMANEMENLKRAISHVPDATANEAITMLREAKRVFLLGQGMGAPLAQLFALGLRTLGLTADNPSADPLSLAIALRDVAADDLVITVSFVLETQELANALRFAREQGARTMALTWSHVSRCAQAAELTIAYLPDDSLPIRPITHLAMWIDGLLQVLAQTDEETYNRVDEFSRIRDRIVSDPE